MTSLGSKFKIYLTINFRNMEINGVNYSNCQPCDRSEG